MSRLRFKLEARCPTSAARACRFETLHGPVETPLFMPVGTQATVKAQNVDSLKAGGATILLANTYHLLLRPGPEVFQTFGGIHRFMQWAGPILTDSGGYQVFSLPHSRTINEAGALFTSYVDGKVILLSPETSIAMQRAINSDIMMAFDQCVPGTADFHTAKAAMELTHRWALRSLKARQDSPQALFGIIQGACHENLRRQSAAFLTQQGFDGYAIGGLAVGESRNERNDFAELCTSLMPVHLPRYLMGVGTPLDLLEAVWRGVDMFDCILPVEQAQRGTAFTSSGKIQLRRTVYAHSDTALDPHCPCPTCQTYSKAYLHHLIKCSEPLGWQLIGRHNLDFYQALMRTMRQEILAGTFGSYYHQASIDLAKVDDEHPVLSKARIARVDRVKCLGDYELRQHPTEHFFNIHHKSSGETMHSVNNPRLEAETLYVTQSGLRQLLAQNTNEALIVWDVGLGAATNAMVTILAAEAVASPRRVLRIYSFENDLDPLRLAIRHAGRLDWMHHPAPAVLLRDGQWQSADGSISWHLVHGDFTQTILHAPAAHVVWYDLYSSKTCGPFWQWAFLDQVRRSMLPGASLFTYSASTAIILALLRAGFLVGSGVSTGPKQQTIRAWNGHDCFDPARLYPGLLGPEWLQRWELSHARYPGDLATHDYSDFEAWLRALPQFKPSIGLANP